MSLNFFKFHCHLFYSKREGSVFVGIHCAFFLAHGNSQAPCIRFIGQAAKTHLKKILVLQKRALRLMYFSEPRAHAVPLFISSKILPLQMLYAEKVSSIMFDVSCMNAPSNICDFFTKANSKHRHETRFSSSGNYYVQTSRLNLNQDSFSRFGAKLWNAIPNEFRQLSKGAFKKNFHDFLLSIMEAEDDYVEVPILLQKMANSASSTQCI